MRTSRAEAWLLISAAGCFLGYLILTWALEQRRFAADCAELGIDRMVQRPSDDDLRRMVDDCERGRRRR